MYHFIYPTKDTFIDEQESTAITGKNYGGTDDLVLKKDFDGSGLNGVTRILMEFDLNSISKSISSNEIPSSATYNLRLYERKSHELSSNYQLNAYALSSSWEEGTGFLGQDPNSIDGVSWYSPDESYTALSWSLGGLSSIEIPIDSASWDFSLEGHPHLQTGSRSVGGGGVWYGENAVSHSIASIGSQSFSYQSPDVDMDITGMVNLWLNGTRQNKGLILKWSGSQEDSTSITGDMNFYSMEANSIYSPKLEIKWDSHKPCTGSNTGSLRVLDCDNNNDNYLYMINLKKEYRETETPKFRVAGRVRYQKSTIGPNVIGLSSNTPYYIPEGSGSYSIKDVHSGEVLIPFSSESLLSCDSRSNYFTQRLDGFITNRLYRISFRLNTSDGKFRVIDNNFDFKVTN